MIGVHRKHLKTNIFETFKIKGEFDYQLDKFILKQAKFFLY